MAIFCPQAMKIQYETPDVRKSLFLIYRQHPDLKDLFFQYIAVIKRLDHAEMVELIKEESRKKNDHKQIKELSDGNYEFRIPPGRKTGYVLRVFFCLAEDFYTLEITGSRVKSFTPRKRKNKKGRKK